jgi:hypothetical protein
MHTQNQQATMLWMVEHDTDRNRACYLICKAFATQINARQCLKKGIYRARMYEKFVAKATLQLAFHILPVTRAGQNTMHKDNKMVWSHIELLCSLKLGLNNRHQGIAADTGAPSLHPL